MSRSIAPKLRANVESAGLRQGWLQPGGARPGILVALSGGSDSMALLSLLRDRRDVDVAAAHLEHGFRAEASIADADFVRAYCESIGVRCYVKHVDVPGARRKGESAEMAGRRARYDFFGELLRREGFAYVATGHTADDVVETKLLNLLRGTGYRGLSGIAGRRGDIVRPVIGCRRDDLRRYLEERGIPWREDETNTSPLYRRNRIRNELLPWVRKNLNESVDNVLLGLAGESLEIAEAAEAEAARLCDALARDVPGALAAWDMRGARALTYAKRAAALREQGGRLSLPVLNRKRTEALCALIARSGRWRFQWAGDVEVAARGGRLCWTRRADSRKY
jgi:tRNA(Ile)-lysidine synthase